MGGRASSRVSANRGEGHLARDPPAGGGALRAGGGVLPAGGGILRADGDGQGPVHGGVQHPLLTTKVGKINYKLFLLSFHTV